MWQAVNVVKSAPNISDPITENDTQLNLFEINGKLALKSCRGDFKSVFHFLTGWFPKGLLKQEFKGIQETTFLGINNFGHIEAMKAIFFWNFWKFYVDFWNAIKLGEDVDGF